MFAIFSDDVSPLATRQPHAEALSIKSKMDSWKWVARQVRRYIQDPNWTYADPFDAISAASAKVYKRVGRRNCPLYVTLPPSVDMLELRRTVRTPSHSAGWREEIAHVSEGGGSEY